MAGQPSSSSNENSSTNMVETMAQALVTALSRELSSNRNTSVTMPLRPQGVPANNAVCPANTTASSSSSTSITSSNSRINQALKRQFPNMFNSKTESKKGKGRFCKSTRTISSKHTDLTVYVLPAPASLTPKASKELELARAGLGKRVVSVPEDYNHNEIVTLLEEEFLKLRPLQGRWMFYKATGGSGQRKLSVIPMDTEGYSGRQLRSVSNFGKNVLFLAPLQEEMGTEPLPYDAAEFAKMPQVPCVTCHSTMPLQMLALHAEECQQTTNDQTDVVIVENSEVHETSEELGANSTETELTKSSHGICPICQKEFPISVLPYHGSVCAERSFTVNMSGVEHPGPSSAASSEAPSGPEVDLWKTVEDQKEAVHLFLQQLRHRGERQPSLLLSLDSRDNDEERDRSLISFYKESHEKIRWAARFRCHIEGDAAIGSGVTRHILSSAITKLKRGFKLNFGNTAETTMFEGEIDHLIPNTSAVLVESELFIMAGRMIGHSIINNGPTLSGLSLAVVNALTGGTKETATSNLSLEDCPDLDHRETIRLLLKEDWTEEETMKVTNLCLDWSYPVPTKETNKLLLFQQLLSHAVLGRVNAQIKQLRKGLKETGIWPLITCRADVVPLLFPRESDVEITSQMVLQWIQWPQARLNHDSEDSDDDMQTETLTLLTGFFRSFVEEASSDDLRQLMRFWTGWEVPCHSLKLEVVQSTGFNHLPSSSTCYERLRLPNHYTTYSALKTDMLACLKSVESGFGLV